MHKTVWKALGEEDLHNSVAPLLHTSFCPWKQVLHSNKCIKMTSDHESWVWRWEMEREKWEGGTRLGLDRLCSELDHCKNLKVLRFISKHMLTVEMRSLLAWGHHYGMAGKSSALKLHPTDIDYPSPRRESFNLNYFQGNKNQRRNTVQSSKACFIKKEL